MVRILFVLLLVTFYSCSRNEKVNNEYMALEEIRYVKESPRKFQLQDNGTIIKELHDVPIKNFCIFDSVLLISTYRDSGLLDIYNINSMKSYGSILNKGKAKGEFVYGINITLQTTFFSICDSLYGYFYDPGTGCLYKVNVTEKIKDNIANICEVTALKSVPRSAFWFKMINDTCCILRTIGEMETRQLRSILSPKGEQFNNKAIETLNEFEIPLNEDFNIMSSIVTFSPRRDMLVEAQIGMNYINIYSIVNGTGFTLCIGNEMDKLSRIISIPKYRRKYMFADIRAYDFGFAILKYDIEEKEYQSNSRYLPSILIFDWEGNPIGEINPPIQYNHFDFDLEKGKLYLLDKDGQLKTYKCNLLKNLLRSNET